MMQLTKGLFGFLFCVILFGVELSAQQAPFTGGEGDGYDMASWSAQTAISPDFSNQIQLASSSITLGDAVKLFSDQAIIEADVKVYDMQGKTILHILWQNSQEKSFFIPNISPGFYFIKIENQDRMAVKNIQILPN